MCLRLLFVVTVKVVGSGGAVRLVGVSKWKYTGSYCASVVEEMNV